MRLIIPLFFSTFLVAAGNILFKIGSKNLSIMSFVSNPVLIIGIFLYGAGAIALIYSLKKTEMSVAFPIYALSYVWVMLGSWLFLGENLTTFKMMGITSIIGGVWLIGGRK